MLLGKMVDSFIDGPDQSEVNFCGVTCIAGYLHYLAHYMVMKGIPLDSDIGIVTSIYGQKSIEVIN